MTEKIKVKPILPVHEKKSREVEEKDMPVVLEDAIRLFNICEVGNGVHEGAYAMAHPQIEKNDPLRFFVLRDGSIIINPAVTRHTRHKVGKTEGCVSMPLVKSKNVQRWNKIEVKYMTFPDEVDYKDASWDKLVTIEKPVYSLDAQIFQHEIDHFDAISIDDRTL